MIPHNMPLFKFICALYQFHHQTLPIMKIDRGQIQFRDYVFTGTEPIALRCVFDLKLRGDTSDRDNSQSLDYKWTKRRRCIYM